MKKTIKCIVSDVCLNIKRLDQFLVHIFSQYSRSCLQKWIISKRVLVNEKIIVKPKTNIFLGDKITIIVDKKKIDVAENIPLDIVYEDEYLLIVNKSSGLVVHPSSGHDSGTLLNALIYKYPHLKNIPRAGIIHRLDKDTTGVMVIAKHMISYKRLVFLLKDKNIIREYAVFVLGNLISGGTINYPITRHIKKRICMMTHITGKSSITYYKIIKTFKYYTYLGVRLETGRTHQIRVHMLYIKHPVLGDPLYKIRNHIPKGIKKNIFDKIRFFSRQALHANKIKFFHPITYCLIEYTIPLPIDMVRIMQYL